MKITPSVSSQRKDDHVKHALDQAEDRHHLNDFDSIRFLHHSLDAVDVKTVSLETKILNQSWSSPFYINAMTGGSEKTANINTSLAYVAAECSIPIASGSMSPIFKDRATEKSFTVLREKNPNGFVMANLSANASLDQAKHATSLISADALQIHVNSVQEVLMSEGDREFSEWLSNIERLVSALEIPVIIKEVGFGLSRRSVEKLLEVGISNIDVAGKGGTNFARIEQSRDSTKSLQELTEWGMSTPESLLDINDKQKTRLTTLFASGGVRNPLDACKCLALGADAVGVAGGFLKILDIDGEESLVGEIERWREVMKAVQTLLGFKQVSEFKFSDLLISNGLLEFCNVRAIDTKFFANRNDQTSSRVFHV